MSFEQELKACVPFAPMTHSYGTLTSIQEETSEKHASKQLFTFHKKLAVKKPTY